MSRDPAEVVDSLLREATLRLGLWSEDASKSAGQNIAENYVAALNAQPGQTAGLDCWDDADCRGERGRARDTGADLHSGEHGHCVVNRIDDEERRGR